MDLIHTLAKGLDLPYNKIKNTVELLEGGNTVPFIARYRKEVTGELDEEQIRKIQSELTRQKNLEDRRQTVLQSIEEQGKLTATLKQNIVNVSNMTELEDLYAPYKPKRRTRAMDARDKGLEPLAKMILDQEITPQNLDELVQPFLTQKVKDVETTIAGAKDIAAEVVCENAAVRKMTREKYLQFGRITGNKRLDASDERKTYEVYYDFSALIKFVKPYQILALNRGAKEKILKVGFSLDEKEWWSAICSAFKFDQRSIFFELLNEAAKDGVKRLLLPSIERDILRQLTEDAEDHAIHLFSENLRALLTQPPLADQTILAIDPGYRTGSKIAVLDPFGKVLNTGTIYPHPPQNKKDEAVEILKALIEKYHVNLIVIGNGTASRETELLVAEITKHQRGLNYTITSEAGASVYSASKLAREEFPDLDVSIRGAVSIGRRVQDPLAELVKIDPRSIGVGLYQHDINQTKLSEALDQAVESVVNAVGVEVNSASATLLTHIAGIGPALAEKIVEHREEHGPFSDRQALLTVAGMGARTFQQAAGFLRIRDGRNPLDATAIHPESYPVAKKILENLKLDIHADPQSRIQVVEKAKASQMLQKLADDLQTGLPTLADILDEIARPGRDPRKDLPRPLLRKDVLSMEDLSFGMNLRGTIRNVVDFGAFIDIGVKNDGLLHRSRIPKGIHLQIGDIVDVLILSVDHDRGRIALGMGERDP